jgi:seryl-tRNA synthetase
MFLPSDSDVNEMDERAGVINGVAKALDKRMDKQAQQQKGDREQLRKEITAVSDDVMGLSKEMNEKLAAIEKSLAALEHGVASSTAGTGGGAGPEQQAAPGYRAAGEKTAASRKP